MIWLGTLVMRPDIFRGHWFECPFSPAALPDDLNQDKMLGKGTITVFTFKNRVLQTYIRKTMLGFLYTRVIL